MTNSLRGPLIGLIVVVVIAVISLVVVRQALLQPVPGDKARFDALIADVSGLVVGNDVRKLGVPVGKVEGIRLENGTARVTFSVLHSQQVAMNTVVAVKYLNLVGQRYLDLTQQQPPSAPRPAGSVIPVAQTIPSFDITTLFNGLQPMFRTLDTEQINRFTRNVLDVIQGDITSTGTAMQDLRQLTAFAKDREVLITTLIRNLGDLARQIQGKSPQLRELVTSLNQSLGAMNDKLDDTNASLRLTHESLGVLAQLIATAQTTFDDHYGSMDAILRKSLPASRELFEILAKIPAIVSGLDAATTQGARASLSCGRGAAELPAPMALLLSGQQVVVCR